MAQATTYSCADCSSLSSCDHSTLYPSSVMSMHGRGMTSSSMIWTVFSSMKRPPHSHAEMMFWLSWVCGPADGPTGVARTLPAPRKSGTANGASGFGT